MNDRLDSQLAAVRLGSPPQSCNVYDHCWDYLEAGSGDPVLLLPGALGEADTSFQYVLALQTTHRVVSVGYPVTIQRLTPLLDGLHVLLAQLGVVQPHIVGGSFSGLVAQYFAARWPQRVRSLLLSNTGAPGETLSMVWPLAAAALGLLPEGTLQAAMQMGIRRFLPGDSPEQAFWRSYFAQRLPGWSRQALAARLHLTGEMQKRANAAHLRRAAYAGPVLIIDAEGDRLVAPRRRQSLRRLYPQAQHAAIAGKGHVAALDEAGTYIKLYREFLCALPQRRAV